MKTSFYGQTRLKKEVELIINEINRGKFFNLMLTAPSGWGKTKLAKIIIEETYGVNKTNFGQNSSWLVNSDMPINFIDEVQTIITQECFYVVCDWGGTNMIFATNTLGGVLEPLLNRCIPLIFDPYTLEDIEEIVSNEITNLPDPIIEAISERAKLNPRIAKKLCERVDYVFNYKGIPKSVKEFDDIIMEILDIDKNGLTAVDRRYLEFLKVAGGKASIDLIKNSLHIDKEAILREIEPCLVNLGYIRITSKGRELLR